MNCHKSMNRRVSITASRFLTDIIVFFDSPLVDGVLLALSRNHSANVTGHTTAREVFVVYHDFSHSIHLDHCLRVKCTFQVSVYRCEIFLCTFLIPSRMPSYIKNIYDFMDEI